MCTVNNEKYNSKPVEFLRPSNDDKKEDKMHHILDILMDSAADSSTHGIDHMFKRDNICIRLFWLVCFLASAGVCAYMIAMSIMNYLDFDTVTKAEQIYAVSTEFPSVSICNLNPFMTNYSSQFVEKILIENGIVNPLAPTAVFNYVFGDSLMMFRYFAGTNALNPNLTDEFRKTLGYSMKDMMISCTYNLNTCTADDFVWYYDILYGNCFTFNGGKYANGSSAPVTKSTRSGLINGLTVELYLYEPYDVMSLASGSGAHVLVHNQTNLPLFTSGIQVSTGTQTNIEIQRLFSSHLEKPYSNCVNDINEDYPSKLVHAILSTGFSYSQQNCFLSCYQRYLIDKCDCYDTSIPLPISLISDRANVRACLTFNDTLCDSAAFTKFFSLDVQSTCGDDCPLECDSVTYNLYVNQADYPAQVYANSLMNNPKIQAKYASNPSNMNYDSLKRNMVQIAVYYGDLGYQQYQELEKMSLGDLISGIGGTLGLFLGMSFLSFVEIFDVMLQIFFYLISKDSDSNSVSPR